MSEAAVAPDPRLDSIRPVVRTGAAGNLGLWIFLAVLLLGGVLLFNALNSARQETDPLAATQGSGTLISAPPPLTLPQGFAETALEPFRPLIRAIRPATQPVAQAPVTRIVERPVAPTLSPDDLASLIAQQQPAAVAQPAPPPPVPADLAPRFDADERVAAGRLLNPSLTVPKGTIVAAVLETALDSTRPGAVRAIVSRDVKSFDGSRVLIPRGSRLYGEYTSEVGAGQKRAMINWTRLTRPDAVVIALDSPAADPLGRAGVEGRVNSHFFARFGSAILQSVLDIGVGLATRSIGDNDTVVVGLPGSTQQVTGQLTQQTQVQPTLKVRQGTSVSVFVARDLDFSTVEL